MVLIKLTAQLQQALPNPQSLPTTTILNQPYIQYHLLRPYLCSLTTPLCTLIPAPSLLPTPTANHLLQPSPPESHLKLIRQLESKHQRRMYDLLIDRKNAPKNYFVRQPDNGVKDLEKTVSFAMTFLFSFWLAGVTGFCMGRYFFGMEQVDSMKMAIGFIVMTIVVETGLFIIKVNKMTEKEVKEGKKGKRKAGGSWGTWEKDREQREQNRYEGKVGDEKKKQ